MEVFSALDDLEADPPLPREAEALALSPEEEAALKEALDLDAALDAAALDLEDVDIADAAFEVDEAPPFSDEAPPFAALGADASDAPPPFAEELREPPFEPPAGAEAFIELLGCAIAAGAARRGARVDGEAC